MSQLSSRDSGCIVRQRKQPEAFALQAAQSARHFRMRWHRSESIRELSSLGLTDLYAASFSEHRQDGGADISEWNIDVGEGKCLGIGDQLHEPQPHRRPVAKNALERRRHYL